MVIVSLDPASFIQRMTFAVSLIALSNARMNGFPLCSVYYGQRIFPISVCGIALRGQLSKLLLGRVHGNQLVGGWKFYPDSKAGKARLVDKGQDC